MKVKIFRRRKARIRAQSIRRVRRKLSPRRLRAKYTHRTDLTVYALCISRLRRALPPMKLPLVLSKENPPEGPAGRISAVTSGLI